MSTLYVRDVPEAVTQTLKERAAARGLSLSAFVADELTRLAARPTPDELRDRLHRVDRSQAPSTEKILRALHAGRR